MSVFPANMQMAPGQNMQLTATVKPSTAQQNVTWLVTPASVATITDTGLVTATGLGQAVVTATTVGKPVQTSTASVTVTTTGTAPPVAGPFIRAVLLSVSAGPAYPGDLQSVDVCTDSSCATPIPDAAVTIDGAALNYAPAKFKYTGSLTINPGRSVVLKVSYAGNDYSTPVSQFATFPTLITPTVGTTWNAGAANNMSWSTGAPAAGASNFLAVIDTSGKVFYPTNGKLLELSIATNLYTVPPGWTTTAGTYYVFVGIGTAGIFDGSAPGQSIPNAAAGSGAFVGGILTLRAVTVSF